MYRVVKFRAEFTIASDKKYRELLDSLTALMDDKVTDGWKLDVSEGDFRSVQLVPASTAQ